MSYPPPVSVVAAPLNNGIKLTITNPTPPSGLTLYQYNVYQYAGGPIISGYSVESNILLIIGPFVGINNGTPYTLAVTNVWDDGFTTTESVPTSANTVTPAAGTPPDAVPISILPKANPANLEIWWDPPPSSGSTPLNSYYIEGASDAAFTGTILQTGVLPGTQFLNINEALLGGPVPTNLNYIRIQAINTNFDYGPFANYLFTQIGFFPSEPQTPTATRTSATSAQVSWTAPASDGGAALQYYVVTSLPVTSGVSTVKSLYATETTVEMTGLSSGVDYTFSIEAVNPPGYSPAAITAAIGP